MIEENSEQANLDIGTGKFVVPIRDILSSLIRGWKTLAVVFAVPVIVSLGAALALPKIYSSEAHLLVLPDRHYTEQPLSRDDSAQPGIDSEQISKIEVEILGSRELKLAVAAQLGPHAVDSSFPVNVTQGSPAYERLLNVAADRLEKLIDVESEIDSSIIRAFLQPRPASRS